MIIFNYFFRFIAFLYVKNQKDQFKSKQTNDLSNGFNGISKNLSVFFRQSFWLLKIQFFKLNHGLLSFATFFLYFKSFWKSLYPHGSLNPKPFDPPLQHPPILHHSNASQQFGRFSDILCPSEVLILHCFSPPTSMSDNLQPSNSAPQLVFHSLQAASACPTPDSPSMWIFLYELPPSQQTIPYSWNYLPPSGSRGRGVNAKKLKIM